jgi:hypothetical protein
MPTAAGTFATFVVWGVAALVMRFGYLVVGAESFRLTWWIGVALLVTSFKTGPRLASLFGFPGEWTDEMLKAKAEELVREIASPAKTVRPLGAVGCVAALFGIGLVAYGLIRFLRP